jgi:hypothetical protein
MRCLARVTGAAPDGWARDHPPGEAYERYPA